MTAPEQEKNAPNGELFRRKFHRANQMKMVSEDADRVRTLAAQYESGTVVFDEKDLNRKLYDEYGRIIIFAQYIIADLVGKLMAGK